uniref:Putative secreted protein n=1 Tax=Ixodes ricinus TaxID=34613 RepID=A0A6B0U9D2_IXORI
MPAREASAQAFAAMTWTTRSTTLIIQIGFTASSASPPCLVFASPQPVEGGSRAPSFHPIAGTFLYGGTRPDVSRLAQKGSEV